MDDIINDFETLEFFCERNDIDMRDEILHLPKDFADKIYTIRTEVFKIYVTVLH